MGNHSPQAVGTQITEIIKVVFDLTAGAGGVETPLPYDFLAYECQLDSAIVRPKLSLTAKCLMPLIGLLTSTEKIVPEGRLI